MVRIPRSLADCAIDNCLIVFYYRRPTEVVDERAESLPCQLHPKNGVKDKPLNRAGQLFHRTTFHQ